MNLQHYFFLAIVGLMATAYKVASSLNKLAVKLIIAETILSFIISLTIVPALMDTYKLSIQQGIGIASIITIFSSLFIKLIEKKITKN